MFLEDLSIPDSSLLEGLDLDLDYSLEVQPVDWLGSLDDVGMLLDEQTSAQLATWDFLQQEPPAGSSTGSPSPTGGLEPPACQAAASSQAACGLKHQPEEKQPPAQVSTAWDCSSPLQPQQVRPLSAGRAALMG